MGEFPGLNPLVKENIWKANYSYRNYGDELKQEVFDLENASSPSEVLNQELSNHYRRGYEYHNGGLNLKFNRKDHRLTAGMMVQNSGLRGEIIGVSDTFSQSWFNWLPHLRWDYEIATSKNLELSYRTSVREPSVDQLQPLVNNSDPLNIYEGNPALRPEYSHELNSHLMIFDQFSFTNFFLNLRGVYTQHKITNSRRVDSLLRSVIQPLNVERDFQLNGYLSFGTPIRPIKSRISIDASATFNRGLIYINEIENQFDRFLSSSTITLENRKKEVIDIAVGAKLSWNLTTYNINQEADQEFLNYQYFADLRITPGKNKKWHLSSSFDYFIYDGGTFGETQYVPLWQASVSRFLFENNRGELTLTAFDILNQNAGISRNTEFNYLEENRFLTLGRYVMLSFTWNLSRFAGSEEGGLQIMRRR